MLVATAVPPHGPVLLDVPDRKWCGSLVGLCRISDESLGIVMLDP
jgi:hypothetical protein